MISWRKVEEDTWSAAADFLTLHVHKKAGRDEYHAEAGPVRLPRPYPTLAQAKRMAEQALRFRLRQALSELG